MSSANLFVNVPRQLRVRVNIANLRAAVTKRVTADFLACLIESAVSVTDLAAKAQEALYANGLGFDQSESRGLTPFGNGLLLDGNNHFEDSLQPTYQYSGYDAARRRIALFASTQLGEIRLAETAGVVRNLQARLDREVNSMQERKSFIAEWVHFLTRFHEAIAQARIENQQEVASLERDRDSLRRPRQTQDEVATSPRGLKNWALYTIRKLRRSLRATPITRDHSSDLLRAVEEELLRTHLRAAVLEAEELTVNDLIRELTAEVARGDQTMALLTGEIHVLRAEAQEAGMSRGWSIASGEICLDGHLLTEAAVAKLDTDGLWAQFSAGYRERHGQDIFAETNGVFGNQDVEEIEEIVSEIVKARLDWNAVDCLASLVETNSGIGNALREAVRQIAERDFLATGYAGSLRHNTFAAITYAPGKTPQANQSFEHLLQDIKRAIDAGVNEYIDYHDHESIAIYIEDRAIPVGALHVYDESLYEAHNLRNNPTFTPHPEIYGISIPTPTAGQTVKRMAEMLRLVINDPVGQVEREGPRYERLTAHAEEETSNHELTCLDGWLGAYIPDLRLIEIYPVNIREAARFLGLEAEVLRRVVEGHEAAHAVVHLGKDADGSAFETESFKLSDGGMDPSPLQETLAQLVCWHFLNNEPESLTCFQILSNHQPTIYRHWEKLQNLSVERLRETIIRLRRGEMELSIGALRDAGRTI